MTVIPWDDYFIYLSKLSSMRSKDPRIKVGACVVDSNNRVKGIGYNGFPRGCDDKDFPWTSRDDATSFYESKHAYVCHAELNAIMNCGHTNLEGMSLYCTHFPCSECAKVIIQSGIKKVVYLKAHRPGEESYLATIRMFKASEVSILKFMPSISKIELEL